MLSKSFEANIKLSIYRNYEDIFPSPSLISQNFSENDFQLFLNEEKDKSIIYFNDNDLFMNLYLNEKTEIDKVLFKIKLKEEAPIFNSFDDIKEKIFQNDRYKKRFSFDINNIFIKDDAIEAQYLNKKRFRDYKDEDYINGFLENENNHYEIDNKRKRGRVPKV